MNSIALRSDYGCAGWSGPTLCPHMSKDPFTYDTSHFSGIESQNIISKAAVEKRSVYRDDFDFYKWKFYQRITPPQNIIDSMGNPSPRQIAGDYPRIRQFKTQSQIKWKKKIIGVQLSNLFNGRYRMKITAFPNGPLPFRKFTQQLYNC